MPFPALRSFVLSLPLYRILDSFVLPEPARPMHEASARADLTRALLAAPGAARALRRLAEKQPGNLPGDLPEDLAALAVHHRVLTPHGGGWRLTGAAARGYVYGGWLEELAALGLQAAGAEDVRCGQRVFWRAGTDGSEHVNEVDVMAVQGARPVLVSCKATAALLLEDGAGDDRLFDALQELAYWNAHFGRGRAIAIFVTTSDFYDESRRRFRSPKLIERARVLNLNTVSADYGTWPRFVGRLREILEAGS
jgi:hypothetical protein